MRAIDINGCWRSAMSARTASTSGSSARAGRSPSGATRRTTCRRKSAAKRDGAGLWRGEFTPPWEEWRAARPLTSFTAAATGNARRMAWPGQNPPAIDVLLHLNVPCAGGSPTYLEIDKLYDGRYRATVASSSIRKSAGYATLRR